MNAESIQMTNRLPIRKTRLPLVIAAITAVLLVAAPRSEAANDNPKVLPPNSHPYGLSYGQWATLWWQWVLGIPEAQNPLLDSTGEFAGQEQSGPVWFLAGTFGNSVERNITVPAGRGIFVPVHNWIFGSGAFDCDPTVPGVTCDVPELRAKAAAAALGVEVLAASIDGTQVTNIRDYRAISPEPFSITYPEGALFSLLPGVYYPQVADGYWLMLAPLNAGAHTLTLRAVNSAAGIDYTITLHLTVK